MNAFFTDYGLKRIAGFIGGSILQSGFPLYLGYSRTLPTKGGANVTEPENSSYGRTLLNNKQVNNSSYTSTVFGEPTSLENGAKITNTQRVVAPEPYDNTEKVVQDWGELPYACFFDAMTGGNLIMVAQLETPIHPGNAGQSSIPLVRIGDMSITIKNIEVEVSV